MDWTTIVVSFVTAIVSSGGIASILFFKESKRARQLQNEVTASAQWRELYDKSEGRIISQANRIDALYKEIGRLRNQKDELTTQNALYTIFRCGDVGCATRKPQLEVKFMDAKR